jgi:chemotaxis protein CheD
MPCKYADWAVEKIHTWFAQRGARVRDVEVKLFGGGFTIEPERKQEIRNIVDVGARNVEVARQTLESLGYRISRESVLGSTGRKLYFYTGTGEVWMKHIRPSLMAREVVP